MRELCYNAEGPSLSLGKYILVLPIEANISKFAIDMIKNIFKKNYIEQCPLNVINLILVYRLGFDLNRQDSNKTSSSDYLYIQTVTAPYND